ncbi:MAG: coproporphyrinogen III oxidase [Syntrophaceae bacterium PtaU1.Bin231]|nr:MAG: coproporphyrinogen III oxidase [Syntrophaceae bacterium PtaU1.Bin231]
MRVAVIAPPYPLEEAPAPPLGVAYVAAAFERAGADVQIFDFIVNRYTPERLQQRLEGFRPDVVGATSVTLNFPPSAGILETVKRSNPRILTVMGGPHVSFDAVNTLKSYPGIDLVVRGEGEKTIAELTSAGFDPAAFPGIRGLAYREGGDIRLTDPREFIADLDTLPLPARHLLPLSRYQALGFPISMITSRGCPYQCIFCQGRRMVGKKIRQRRAAAVVDEIESILSYGFDRINIADDLFVSDRQKVRDVCGEIERRELQFAWSAFARVNTVDRETLETMKRAGCDAISFGVESGSQAILDRIQKKITLEQVKRAVGLCREVDLLVHCSFIVGLPGETPETLQETKAFAESLEVYFGYHLLAPFPGTTVRENVADYDLEILTEDWTQYDANRAIVRTSALAPDDIRRFVEAFDREIEKQWEQKIRGYREGTNTPLDNLRVEGRSRTPFIFRLLSEDLIESCGTFPGAAASEETLLPLCRRIEEKAGAGMPLIEKVIRDFAARGYIKARRMNGVLSWYWTHNNRIDRWPDS